MQSLQEGSDSYKEEPNHPQSQFEKTVMAQKGTENSAISQQQVEALEGNSLARAWF